MKVGAFVATLILLATCVVGCAKHGPVGTLGGNTPYPVTARANPSAPTSCYADLDTVILRYSATATDKVQWCSDSADSYQLTSFSPSNPFSSLTLPLAINANSCTAQFSPNQTGSFTYVLQRKSDNATCDPNVVVK